MKFIDFFAGIGGFHSGLESAGYEMIGWVEWDKYARKSYEAYTIQKGSTQLMTLNQSKTEKNYQQQTCGLSDRHAQILAWLEAESESRANNQACSLKLSDSLMTDHGKRNLPISSWKMLKTCFLQTEDGTLPQSSIKWTKLGMMSNGKCLIPAGLSRKTVNEYTLLDTNEE